QQRPAQSIHAADRMQPSHRTALPVRLPGMERRPFGNTGLTISALGFGCGTAGGLMVKGTPAEQQAAVERAVAAGITYFDTAPNYGDGLSEANLGRAIREAGVRDGVLVGTKVGLLEPDRA